MIANKQLKTFHKPNFLASSRIGVVLEKPTVAYLLLKFSSFTQLLVREFPTLNPISEPHKLPSTLTVP
jgi:hypothetical protein